MITKNVTALYEYLFLNCQHLVFLFIYHFNILLYFLRLPYLTKNPPKVIVFFFFCGITED
jgi:hypothetical protein